MVNKNNTPKRIKEKIAFYEYATDSLALRKISRSNNKNFFQAMTIL
jgi:hypothetical protein